MNLVHKLRQADLRGLVLPLAVITFFAAFIPIIGAVSAGALAVVIALVTNGLTNALLVLALEVGVEDRGDALRADPGQGVDLARQPGTGLLVVGDVGAQHLDRHGAAALVEGQVDGAHATLPQLLEHAVGPDRVVVRHTGLSGLVRGRVAPEQLRRHAPQRRRPSL